MTSTETRYDIHRIASEGFDPENYDFVGVIDTCHDPIFRADDRAGRKAIDAKLAEGFEFANVHPHGQCDSCGNRLRYVVTLCHRPSDGLIEVGLDCLDGRFSMAKDEVAQMVKEAKAAREAHKLLDGFLAACADDQTLAYATYAQNILAADVENDLWTEGLFTLADIARKCRRYGNGASEGQRRFMDKIFATLDRNAARAAERRAQAVRDQAEEKGSFIAEPGAKKVAFAGTVRLAREFATQWGVSTLLVIDIPEGAVKWFTSSATELDEGREVRFTATVKAHEVYHGERQTVIVRPKFL